MSHLHVSSGLEEMLPHVVLEVVEKLHLLLHISGELVHCVVVLEKMPTLKCLANINNKN